MIEGEGRRAGRESVRLERGGSRRIVRKSGSCCSSGAEEREGEGGGGAGGGGETTTVMCEEAKISRVEVKRGVLMFRVRFLLLSVLPNPPARLVS
jgi:hypothetical protein